MKTALLGSACERREGSSCWRIVYFTIKNWVLPVGPIKEKMCDDDRNIVGELEEKYKFYKQLSDTHAKKIL